MQNAIDWTKQDSSSSVKSYTLNGVIASHQTVQVEVSMNDNSGGSVRLIQDNKIWDLVGWGYASSGVCKEEDLAPIPANTKSIHRAVDDSGYFIDTDNNFADFSHSTTDVKLTQTHQTIPILYQQTIVVELMIVLVLVNRHQIYVLIWQFRDIT